MAAVAARRMRSMAKPVEKFILLWCNSLFLEENVISTNDVALEYAQGSSGGIQPEDIKVNHVIVLCWQYVS